MLICGQTGVGKSHLAQALAHEAARQGADVVFVTAHHLLSHINGGRADVSYERRLASYVRAGLLVIDDFGLKPFPLSGSVDFYDLIHERSERATAVLTSNRAPDEWQELFDNPLLANAALDRLAHRATILTISGRSYRLTDRADGKEGLKTTTNPATP